jgi:hypothetical protein
MLARVQGLKIRVAVDTQDNGLASQDELLLPILQRRLRNPRRPAAPGCERTDHHAIIYVHLTETVLNVDHHDFRLAGRLCVRSLAAWRYRLAARLGFIPWPSLALSAPALCPSRSLSLASDANKIERTFLSESRVITTRKEYLETGLLDHRPKGLND